MDFNTLYKKHETDLKFLGIYTADAFENQIYCDVPSPEFVNFMANDPKLAFEFSLIHGRFEAGEETIATSALYSFLYAINVINGRFEKGEVIIKTNDEAQRLYKNFLQTRVYVAMINRE